MDWERCEEFGGLQKTADLVVLQAAIGGAVGVVVGIDGSSRVGEGMDV